MFVCHVTFKNLFRTLSWSNLDYFTWIILVFNVAVEKKTEVVDGREKCDLEKWFPVGRFGMARAMSHHNHD